MAKLQEKDQEFAAIMEEEMANQEYLQQLEEVKAQSQEIQHLLSLIKKQQEAIEHLSSPKSPPREPRATSSHFKFWLDIMRDKILNLVLKRVILSSHSKYRII